MADLIQSVVLLIVALQVLKLTLDMKKLKDK